MNEEARIRGERETTLALLRLLNDRGDTHELIRGLAELLKKWTGCSAVGVRVREGDDFPYYELSGFPDGFSQVETGLCRKDPRAGGQPASTAPTPDGGGGLLPCLCANILYGRLGDVHPRLTPRGSFWSNGNSSFRADLGESQREALSCERCALKGFESSAYIPLRYHDATLGMLQISDRATGRFTPELLDFLERVADQIAVALALRAAEAAVRKSERIQKEAEERQRQKQRLESIERLAAGVAHNQNNLLTPILGYSKMLLATLEPEKRPHAQVEEIRKAAERSRDLVLRLLAFGRRRALDLKPIDLSDVLCAMEDRVRRALRAGIVLRIDMAGGVLQVRADRRLVEEAILNLVDKAQSSMPQGGTLSIVLHRACAEETEGLHRTGITMESPVLLRVCDTGPGMNDEVRAHVFEPFPSTEGDDTGLGLAAVWGIVQQHGGNVLVDCPPGCGTWISVYLPGAPAG